MARRLQGQDLVSKQVLHAWYAAIRALRAEVIARPAERTAIEACADRLEGLFAMFLRDATTDDGPGGHRAM